MPNLARVSTRSLSYNNQSFAIILKECPLQNGLKIIVISTVDVPETQFAKKSNQPSLLHTLVRVIVTNGRSRQK